MRVRLLYDAMLIMQIIVDRQEQICSSQQQKSSVGVTRVFSLRRQTSAQRPRSANHTVLSVEAHC